MRYSDIVTRRSTYDWSAVDKKLAQIAGRKHQAILRFYFVYPGRKTAVPAYIKALTDYNSSMAHLHTATGTSLERNKIQFAVPNSRVDSRSRRSSPRCPYRRSRSCCRPVDTN